MVCYRMHFRSVLVLRTLAWLALIWGVPLGDCTHGQQLTTQDPAGQASGAARYCGLECIGQLSSRRSDQIDGSRWGVSCHWIADKHELSVEKQLDQLVWLGAKWALLCPDWDRIETERGKYDWNSPAHCFDDVIAGLVARKIAPVIQIYGGNRLYMSFEPDPNQRALADAAKLLDDTEVRQAWHRFIETMVRRYRGQVKVWEVWNEPNYPSFWKTKTTVQDYGRVVENVASVIRRVDPQAVILGGATAGVPLDYVEGFLAGDGANSFDHWAVHPYGELPEKQNESIRRIQELLRTHGKSPVLWQSECGFPSSADTGGWGFGGPWDETKHAKWVLRRLLSDAMLGMQASVYFVLNDYPARLEGGPNRGEMGVNRKGLFAADSWTPKPAACAYRNLAGLIDERFDPKPTSIAIELIDSGSFGQVRSENISTYMLQEKTTGSPLVVYWLSVPMQTEVVPGKITLSMEDRDLKNPVLVDLLNGRVYRSACAHTADGKVTFKDLPLSDHPLVLCDSTVVEPLARL